MTGSDSTNIPRPWSDPLFFCSAWADQQNARDLTTSHAWVYGGMAMHRAERIQCAILSSITSFIRSPCSGKISSCLLLFSVIPNPIWEPLSRSWSHHRHYLEADLYRKTFWNLTCGNFSSAVAADEREGGDDWNCRRHELKMSVSKTDSVIDDYSDNTLL